MRNRRGEGNGGKLKELERMMEETRMFTSHSNTLTHTGRELDQAKQVKKKQTKRTKIK